MASVDWQKTNVSKMARMGKHFDNRKREKSNHRNEDINKELTKDNYYLGCKNWNDILKKSKNFIKEMDEIFPPKKKQDQNERITMVALEIPCPRIITEQGRSEEFFELTNELLASKFAGYSGMAVHVDEVHDYIDHGIIKTSCEHGHAFTPAYAEWTQTTKKGLEQRQGINGKNFVTRQAMIELNNAMNAMCLGRFGVPYLTGGEARKVSVERLKQDSYKALNKEIKIKQRESAKLENEIENLKSENNFLYNENLKFDKKINEKNKELEEINNELEETQTAVNELEKKGDDLHSKLTEEKENFNTVKNEFEKLKSEINNLIPQYQLNKEEAQDFVDSLHNAFLQGIYAGRKIESEKMDNLTRENFINNAIQKQFKEISPFIKKIQNNNVNLMEKIKEKVAYFNTILEKRKEEKKIDKNLNQFHYEDYFNLYFNANGQISEKSEKFLERQITNMMYEKIDNNYWQNLQKIYLDLDQTNRDDLVNYIKKDCIRYLKDYNANAIENKIKEAKFKNYVYSKAPQYCKFGSGLIQKLQQLNRENLDGYER